MFDFGVTQVGKTVHDLTLPPWAKGDPKRFVRIHRQVRDLYQCIFLMKSIQILFCFTLRDIRPLRVITLVEIYINGWTLYLATSREVRRQ